jgi:CheY-like chemotaxis protein
MPLESLLLSRDQHTIAVLRPTLEKLSIEIEVCRGARSGTEILSSEKFDAIIVDCDDLQGGLEVLQSLRRSPSNRNSVTFALLNGKTTTHQAFEMGANFVLQKPISQASALRCFSAALGFMERERRRYFRYPIEIALVLGLGEGQEVKATSTNISEGGMAIRFRGKLPRGRISKVAFTLPGGVSLEPRVEMAWMDGGGRAGLRFFDLPKSSRKELEEWLVQQPMEKEA